MISKEWINGDGTGENYKPTQSAVSCAGCAVSFLLLFWVRVLHFPPECRGLYLKTASMIMQKSVKGKRSFRSQGS